MTPGRLVFCAESCYDGLAEHSPWERHMQVQLDGQLVRLLQRLAEQQERGVDELVKEAVEQYLIRQQEAAEFDADIRRIMDEHAWLLKKLAKS
jgi:predicted transcriptional regulator